METPGSRGMKNQVQLQPSPQLGVSFCRNTTFSVALKNVLCSKPRHDTFWVNIHTNWWQTQNWSRKLVAVGDIEGKQMISKDL